MISEIRLTNYKRFLAETIPLEPITVFTGPNGAGKSTIASALYAISTIVRLGLSAAFPQGFFSFFHLLNYSAKKFGFTYPPMGFGISGKKDDFSFDYDIFFNKDTNSPTGWYIQFEGIRVLSGNSQHHYSIGRAPDNDMVLPTVGTRRWIAGLPTAPQRDCLFLEIERGVDQPDFVRYLREIKKYMQMMSRYQFSATEARMASEQYDGSGRQPFLKSDGSNLAEVVQFLQEERRGLLVQMKDWIIKYAKGGTKIVDVGVATYEDKVFLNFYEEGEGRQTHEVRGPLLSDGYWIFAAFACLASGETLPSIAFFEEPECHLHPHKLPLLCDIFGSMATRQSGPCQVLISTHSPYFLDLFKENPNSVIFLNNGRAQRLSAIPDYENVLSLYSLGEAWYANIFNWGNPQ